MGLQMCKFQVWICSCAALTVGRHGGSSLPFFFPFHLFFSSHLLMEDGGVTHREEDAAADPWYSLNPPSPQHALTQLPQDVF